MIEFVSRTVAANRRVQIAAKQGEVTDHVEQFMSGALVGSAKDGIDRGAVLLQDEQVPRSCVQSQPV